MVRKSELENELSAEPSSSSNKLSNALTARECEEYRQSLFKIAAG